MPFTRLGRISSALGLLLAALVTLTPGGVGANPREKQEKARTMKGLIIEGGHVKAAAGHRLLDDATQSQTMELFPNGVAVPSAKASCVKSCEAAGRCVKHYDDDAGMSCEGKCCDLTISALKLLAAAETTETPLFRASGNVVRPKPGHVAHIDGNFAQALVIQAQGSGLGVVKAYCICEDIGDSGCHWTEKDDGSAVCGGRECCGIHTVNEVKTLTIDATR